MVIFRNGFFYLIFKFIKFYEYTTTLELGLMLPANPQTKIRTIFFYRLCLYCNSKCQDVKNINLYSC